MFFWILPIGVFGKVVDELDRARALEARELRCAMRDQCLLVHRLPALQRDVGDRHLAPLVVRDAEHRAFRDRRMLVEHVLDFLRIDVLAAGNDHVLRAVDRASTKPSSSIVPTIARPAPAVAELEEAPWSAPARCNIRSSGCRRARRSRRSRPASPAGRSDRPPRCRHCRAGGRPRRASPADTSRAEPRSRPSPTGRRSASGAGSAASAFSSRCTQSGIGAPAKESLRQVRSLSASKSGSRTSVLAWVGTMKPAVMPCSRRRVHECLRRPARDEYAWSRRPASPAGT